MLEEMTSAAQLLAEGARILGAAHVPDPRREALGIWSDLTGTTMAAAQLRREAVVEPLRAEAYLRAVDRRAAGEPRAYVTGVAGFRRLELRVDRRVLIPRPETEGLVELVLPSCNGARVADVCTGSGCIALSIRDEAKPSSVIGIDLSADALAIARMNAERLALDVTLVEGDMTQDLGDASVDVLVSNPPYIASAEYLELDPSVREWEPRMALESGTTGLGATTRLLDDGRRVLVPGGLLAIELDASRAAASAGLARAAGWRDVTVHDDLFGRARYLLARRSEDT